MTNIVTIGSSTLDCVVSVKDIMRFELFERDIIKKYTAIEYSRKLNLEDVRFFPGGSGANIASNCANFGFNASYVGVLGNDFAAKMCIDDMTARGVDLSHVTQTDEMGTAFSVILKTEWGKDRSILAYKGANNLLSPDHVKEELFDDIKAFAWTSLTSDSGVRAIEKAIKLTKENGGLVFAAPSMSIIMNNPEWAKKLIASSDVVSMNAEEAEEFTKEPERYYAVKKIFEMGPHLVSITDGAKGSVITDGKLVVKSGIYDVPVIDTTGAGDAFLSGILLSKINDLSLEMTTKVASALSAFEAMEAGAREGIPRTVEEARAFIDSHSLKQEVSKVSHF